MNKQRYRRNLIALLFIFIVSIIVLIAHWYYQVNKFYDIEDRNAFYWQKHMNEEEFASLEEGMSYMDVVNIANGEGDQLSEEVFVWDDEILVTQAYEIHFKDGELEHKKVIEKRGYSTR